MTANLELVRAHSTDPCLTASIAYSTWCRRPTGLNVVTSVSYWLRNMKLDCFVIVTGGIFVDCDCILLE